MGDARAGLLATQGIRGGANRRVLERIKNSGDIFFAESDRDWILDGANVHVSMVGFDAGKEISHVLDGRAVATINANLTATADTTVARSLSANVGISFMGDTKGGAFEVPFAVALEMLASPNAHGCPNSDVIVPWVNGLDVTRRPRDLWIIDFGASMPCDVAARYEAPFEHISANVRVIRETSRSTAKGWWLHDRPRPELRHALGPLRRFLVTVRVSKHRISIWFAAPTLPDSATFAFAREDDCFFGILHSRLHEVWARVQGTQVRERESGFRYTPTTCFETFPLPDASEEESRD